ncbi:MBL fold metallo-hydrolase [Geoalkalibacter halelectricus]|uniref:MBL fold metallo-hydrolase n=1 Tax=Geoalkalibacter halelectricus TaxID=2847045 RepID=A0ABY5ZS31_9BACT|nr:MBL fold metallo-hydrolase [Geoalkalibacter halelectricus]MDO3379979.1 MBL fold metallo-hydrolase [Geoalkalibacter halelectricus]UWZ80494.1 MBL fold metallo-hydrolase [Geoalkalibacter halelectricus]
MTQPLRLTILCENTVGRPIAAVGEHGFACLIESGRDMYLFDTGQGLGLVRNARALKKDLTRVSKVILSHGHYDHTGGLPDLLTLTGPIEVIAHPGIFAERYWSGLGPRRYIGIPHRRPYLQSLGCRFRFETDFSALAPGIWITGEVPRRHPLEKGDANMVSVDAQGRETTDALMDDLSLVIDSPRGLILVLGCAHAGLINILHHVREKTGRDRFHAVVGGTHLMAADDAQFEDTVRALEEFGVEKIAAGHCTGLARAAQLHARLKERFVFAAVGTQMEVNGPS